MRAQHRDRMQGRVCDAVKASSSCASLNRATSLTLCPSPDRQRPVQWLTTSTTSAWAAMHELLPCRHNHSRSSLSTTSSCGTSRRFTRPAHLHVRPVQKGSPTMISATDRCKRRAGGGTRLPGPLPLEGGRRRRMPLIMHLGVARGHRVRAPRRQARRPGRLPAAKPLPVHWEDARAGFRDREAHAEAQ